MPIRQLPSGPIARLQLALLAASLACATGTTATLRSTTSPLTPARYLYVWAGDKDEKSSDFLAVVDVDRTSPEYGQVVSTVPVGMTGTLPHHMEYSLPAADQFLFANGHHHEATFLFDTRDAREPKLVRNPVRSVETARAPADMDRMLTTSAPMRTLSAVPTALAERSTRAQQAPRSGGTKRSRT